MLDVGDQGADSTGGGRTERIGGGTPDQVAVQRLELARDLQRAISDKQFRVYYQPIVDLEARRIVGFEALVRWR